MTGRKLINCAVKTIRKKERRKERRKERKKLLFLLNERKVKLVALIFVKLDLTFLSLKDIGDIVGYRTRQAVDCSIKSLIKERIIQKKTRTYRGAKNFYLSPKEVTDVEGTKHPNIFRNITEKTYFISIDNIEDSQGAKKIHNLLFYQDALSILEQIEFFTKESE